MTLSSAQTYDEVLEWLLSGTIAVDSVNVVGTLVGLALNAGVLNDTIPLKVDGRLTKAGFAVTAEVWALGDRIYWDPTGLKFTRVVTRHRVGFAASAKTSSSSVADVIVSRSHSGQVMGNGLSAADTLGNLAVETAFATTFSLPAGTIQQAEIYEIGFQGLVTAQNSTDTHRAKVKIGTQVLLDTGAVDPGTNDIFGGFMRLIIRTVGASGTAYGVIESQYLGAPATATAKPGTVASFTLDTTAAQAITATMTHSVQNAGNTDRLDALWCKRIG